MIKEIRNISAGNLRNLCIKERFYTKGNSVEYGNLLYKLSSDKKNLTTKNIIAIATDIKKHSRTEKEIEDICFDVAWTCNSYFINDKI